jgi:hypothetical protein
MRSPSIQVNPQKYIGESRMAALGWKVDVQAGQMSAFTDTGRSDALRNADLNGS